MPFSYHAPFSLREVLHVPPDNSYYPPLATACTLHQYGFGLFPLRSPLLRESLLISSPPGTEMVQFPGYRFSRLCIQRLIPDRSGGLPHSAINGSQDMCSSPSLLAACHGLLRRAAPRHPPYALSRLTILCFTLPQLFTALHVTMCHRYSLIFALPFPRYVKEKCSGALPQLRLCMEIVGLEPATYGLQSHRSSQLSYIPITWRMHSTQGFPRACHLCPKKKRKEIEVGHGCRKENASVVRPCL